MLAPAPVIWLPNDESGVAIGEAADLESYHDLAAIVDPEEAKRADPAESKGKRRDDLEHGETSSPLLGQSR
jgi:hypothetical protein